MAWDLITPFGNSTETWAALRAGQYINDHAPARASRRNDDSPRATQLAIAAAGGACRDTTLHELRQDDTALIVGTSKGTVVEWFSGAGLRPEFLADMARDVARSVGIGGPSLTVSAACASGIVALIRGAMMIESGEARRVLIVATEASLHPLFLASFARLGVLPPPGHGCRPFDATRSGFLMSEAAAAVMLEPTVYTGEAASGDSRAITIDRYAFGGDATHLTGADPDARLLRRLLSHVIDGRPVDLVHAHGTGTEMNDAAEVAALDDCLPPVGQSDRPVLYSHKAALGHSLGASGLVSVVLNCQAHCTGVVPPNARTRDPLPTRRMILSAEPAPRDVGRSIAVAAGFGGAVAAVALSSHGRASPVSATE